MTSLSRRAFVRAAVYAPALSFPWLAGAAAPSPTAPAAQRRFTVPRVGMGTFLTFDRLPGAPRDDLRQAMRRFHELGGRLVDTSPLYGNGEVNVGDFAAELGVTDELFIANKIWSTGEFLWDSSHAARSLDRSLERLWRSQIDLMQCHTLVNADVVVPLLKGWKREGRIRFVGVSHHETPSMDLLADTIAKGGIDSVQVNYSIFNRAAERRLLPLARSLGMEVLVNMPFEKARLFPVVQGKPLPAVARELGIESWAEYFLKFALSHPAVSCVLPATSNAVHVEENMRALRGDLPDAATRERLYAEVAKLPGFGETGSRPWYPGKQYAGLINRARAQVLRDAGP